MSREIWLISDTHFMHRNILNFTDSETGELLRGARFSSIEEHDETIRDNWNKKVKKDDIVYHLGDVMIGPKDQWGKLYHSLNGRKRLIVGNHDDIKYMCGFFQKVQMWRMFPEFGLLLTHVPIDPSGLHRYNDGSMLTNVHGHIHHHKSPTKHHVNVSCEAIDYTPINIEELRTK